MTRWYMSDRQIVDRITTEWYAQEAKLHSGIPGENERAVRAIARVAWDYAVTRRRRRFRWWPW